MNKGNRRDTKFLIFQSLYIIAISILFYKGTDLSLTKVINKTKEDTVVTIVKLDSLLKLQPPDLENKVILEKPRENEQYQPVSKKDTVLTKEELLSKENELARLKILKTPVNQRQPTQRNIDKNSHPATIEGETPK